MIDAKLIPLQQRLLAHPAKHLAARGVQADTISIAGFILGALVVPALWLNAYNLALSLLLLNRLADGLEMPDFYQQKVRDITAIVVAEIAAALPPHRTAEAATLAPSLLAAVHGHCFFTLNGTFALMGEDDPIGAAYARVREAVDRA